MAYVHRHFFEPDEHKNGEPFKSLRTPLDIELEEFKRAVLVKAARYEEIYIGDTLPGRGYA